MTEIVSKVRRIVTLATLLVTSVCGTGGGAPRVLARNDSVLDKADGLSSYGILPLKVAIQKHSGKSLVAVATNRDLENLRRHLIEPTLENDPLAVKGKYDVLVVFGTRKDYLDALEGIVHVSGAEHSMRDKGIFCLNKNVGAVPDSWISGNDKDARRKLIHIFEQRACVENLRRLHNPSSRMDASLRVSLLRMDGTSLQMTGEDAVSNYKIKVQLKPGDQFKLVMENESDKAIYVSAFAMNNPNAVTVLYPIPRGPFGNFFIEPSMTGIAPHGRVETACLRYVPGDGVVKFIVSAAPAELGFLDTEMSNVCFHPNSPLSYFLARELALRNFHSDMGEVPETDSWAAFSLEL